MEKLILVFDTETTGFPKPGKELDEQPHIVQLGYVLINYDTDTFQYEIFDRRQFVANPGVPIPEEVAKIHGITDDIASRHQDFKSQCGAFFRHAVNCDLIVGHNVDFDLKMLKIEASRIWEDEAKRNAWIQAVEWKLICTMQSSVKLCQLPYPSGRKGFKWPKLAELHKFLFDRDFENAHSALGDVEATVDCFVELHKRKKIEIH